MSRHYPDGTPKKYQSFQLYIDVDLLTPLSLPQNFTRHHRELSVLVNELLRAHTEKEEK